MPQRAVIDTNVFLSALWSARGAAFEIFSRLRRGQWQMVLSNHLLFEYEEIGKRNAAQIGLTPDDIDAVLDAICASAEQRPLEPDWIPRLVDPDDEPLLQLAVGRPSANHRYAQFPTFEACGEFWYTSPETGRIFGHARKSV